MDENNDKSNKPKEEEYEDPDYSGVGICHPAHNFHRYFFMVFMCSIGIGNYFVYDVPGALQEETIADMGISTSEFTLLYAFYNWPNTVLSLFGGYLVDRFFGITLGAIIFSCFTSAGTFLLGVGAYTNHFWLMCFGRFIFAIGGENLAVCANMRAVKWFKGKELSMVFGLQLSIARAGSTITFNVMKPMYDWLHTSYGYSGHKCLGVAFMIAAVMCAYDLIMSLIIGIRDRRAERILKTKDVKADKIQLKDIKEFKLDYWTVSFIILFYYVAVFPFISLGIPFYKRKFEFSATQANTINSIVYLISMVASPFLGAFIGQLGRNITFTLVSVATSWLAHALLGFTLITPWVGMCILGIGYSLLACTVWPMISLVVPEKQLGTAYGITQALQNLGLGLIMFACGYIVDSKGYLVLEIFFLAWISLAIICIMVLFVYDENKGGILNMTPKQRSEATGKQTTNESQNADQLGIEGSYKTADI